MSTGLIRLEHITAEVGGNNLLNDINLSIQAGEIHVLMGPNGAGKSTLGNVLMGHPSYMVTNGTITFMGEDITELAPEKRAQRGLFLSFQNPVEVPGITLETFLRTAKSALTGEEESVFGFHLALKAYMQALEMDVGYAQRHLNVGFSGGEKKKSEILQMLTLNPKLAILDETDSGLDVDAVRVVSKGIEQFHSPSNALLIITHNTRILDSIKPDQVHVLSKGRLVANGGSSLIKLIEQQGYVPFQQAGETSV